MSTRTCIAVEFHTSIYENPLNGLTQFYELIHFDRNLIHFQVEIDSPVREFTRNIHPKEFLSKHQIPSFRNS